jgi:hypothetical protein
MITTVKSVAKIIHIGAVLRRIYKIVILLQLRLSSLALVALFVVKFTLKMDPGSICTFHRVKKSKKNMTRLELL